MSQLRTSPTSAEIGSKETFALGVDCSQSLQSGETPNAGGAPVAYLYDDTDGGTDVSATCIAGFPTVSGNVVTPIITLLEAGHQYRLIVVFKPNGVESRETVTVIVCPE